MNLRRSLVALALLSAATCGLASCASGDNNAAACSSINRLVYSSPLSDDADAVTRTAVMANGLIDAANLASGDLKKKLDAAGLAAAVLADNVAGGEDVDREDPSVVAYANLMLDALQDCEDMGHIEIPTN